MGNARGDLGLFREASEAFSRALEIYGAWRFSRKPARGSRQRGGCLGGGVGKRDLFQRATHVRIQEGAARRACWRASAGPMAT